MSYIFKEVLHNGLTQEIIVTKTIANKKSKYQKIQIFDTQSMESFSFRRNNTNYRKRQAAYSEMLVHSLFRF